MKITVDFVNKTIMIDQPVNLATFFEKLQEFIPKKKWSEYKLIEAERNGIVSVPWRPTVPQIPFVNPWTTIGTPLVPYTSPVNPYTITGSTDHTN